ncbi:MAG TPA: hypothetical protein VNK26_04795 [Pyrinomonadaceae bacterium]|jgi:hypothetical protein|nr:hypothetical protein [Pyrinomonadaceae bacterium]
MNLEERERLEQAFGSRIQRCYGCFVAFYLKDMYLGEDVSFFCENCRDETMFHFSEFVKRLDLDTLSALAASISE